MFTIDLKDKTLNTLTELKDTYAISNELANHCDIFAEAINNDEIPDGIRENICNFISSCLNNDIQSLDSRIKYSNNISRMLNENYKLRELKYTQTATNYDMTQETIFILGSIVVTLLALFSGSGILIAGASIGLGLALTDMLYRLPNDIHSELKNDSEYKNLSLTEKLSRIAKETLEDKLKLSCVSINLVGAVFLFAVLFSPALIMSAPISVPLTIGVMGIVAIFSIGKKYYEYKSKLNEIEENTKNIHKYSNNTLNSISSFKHVLNDAKEEKIKIEESTHVENNDEFKKYFTQEHKKTNEEKLDTWAKSLSSSNKNGLYTKIKNNDESEGEGEGGSFIPKP